MHKADNVITWPNGSAVFLRSVQDPEMILGLDLAWAVADELGLWKARAWDYLQNRLRQPGYPHMIRGGYTPKGAAHWTAERLVPSDETEVIRSSLMDNPSVTPDVIDRVRREYGEGSDLWRQEVLGEFVAWQGLVYAFDGGSIVPTRRATAVHLCPCRRGLGLGEPGAIVVVGIDEYDCAWSASSWSRTSRYRSSGHARRWICSGDTTWSRGSATRVRRRTSTCSDVPWFARRRRTTACCLASSR